MLGAVWVLSRAARCALWTWETPSLQVPTLRVPKFKALLAGLGNLCPGQTLNFILA